MYIFLFLLHTDNILLTLEIFIDEKVSCSLITRLQNQSVCLDKMTLIGCFIDASVINVTTSLYRVECVDMNKKMF